MSEAEAGKLSGIAGAIGIGRPAVCVLLVHREVREERLDMLVGRWTYFAGKVGRRITARMEAPGLKEAFARRVGAVGLAADEAAYLLFRAEIAENWLADNLVWNHG